MARKRGTSNKGRGSIRTKKYTPRGPNPNIDPNVIVDGFNGEAKFIRRGRRKERSLKSMESREDLKLRDELFKMWRNGKLKKTPHQDQPPRVDAHAINHDDRNSYEKMIQAERKRIHKENERKKKFYRRIAKKNNQDDNSN